MDIKNLLLQSKYTNQNTEECSICIESNENKLCRELKCGHTFHCKCCDKWFRENNTCPICRLELDTNINDSDLDRTLEEYIIRNPNTISIFVKLTYIIKLNKLLKYSLIFYLMVKNKNQLKFIASFNIGFYFGIISSAISSFTIYYLL